MKKIFFVLIGLIVSASLLLAQEKPMLDVCLGGGSAKGPRFVATQKVIPERNAYQVEVHTMVCNMTAKPKNVKVTVKVLDARGKLINSRKEPLKLGPGSAEAYGTFIPIDKPKIWNGVGEPYKYKVTVAVRKDYSESDFYFHK